MDWSNEDYVRLYTRETADDLELSWEALALWRSLLIKFDRAGLIPLKNGWVSVARLARMPIEIVQQVGPELVRDGRIKMIDGAVYAPNFMTAQTASKSDKLRQKESRERRRETANDAPQVLDTTLPGHDVSQAVTPGHAPSRNVTLTLANLTSADMSGEPDVTALFAESVIAEINRVGGRKYKADSDSVTKLCRALIKAKYTAEQAVAVVASKREWIGDPKMGKFFRPKTLLALDNFGGYLDDLEAGNASTNQTTGQQSYQQSADRADAVSPLMLAFEDGLS